MNCGILAFGKLVMDAKIQFSLVGVALALSTGLVAAQTGTRRLEFDVASIKVNKSDPLSGTKFNNCAGGRLAASNSSVRDMIDWAYDIMQQFALPKWADYFADTYSIEAKAVRLITVSECKLMLQSLLEDRFRLKLHKEVGETQAYVLAQTKGGSKLQNAKMDNPGPADGIWLQGIKIGAKGWDTPTIARWLATGRNLSFPVIDGTGLEGLYQFKIEFSSVPGGDGKPDIFQALQEQLGLRLELRKNVPIEFFVIDHLERPSDN